MECSNCSSTTLRILNTVDSAESMAITSDAQVMEETRAKRTLCEQCGCMEIHFTPMDRLRRYFQEQFDISDAVQDNLIVHAGRAVSKRDHIFASLFPQLESRLGPAGRFLEIACGRGELWRMFQKRYPMWECIGIDPSSESPEEKADEGGNIRFIRDYFNICHFEGMTFDLIIAHGFLNRSPVLPELLRIRNICRKGTLLSFELLVLENSVFAPYIWDHSHMYIRDVFEAYLAHAGFTQLARTDCVSSVHYLCECREDSHPREKMRVPAVLVENTVRRFSAHIEWWKSVLENHKKVVIAHPGDAYALFGAGLYNAVFLNLLDTNPFRLVIDEIKAGTQFFGLPVLGIKEAAAIQGCRVLICSRPEYLQVIEHKLERGGIAYSSLIPEGKV